MYAKIIGTGSYLPKQVMTNNDLSKTVDTSDAWIQQRTGIKQRHKANETETTAFMASQAGQHALTAAGIKASEIDLILVATTTPDDTFPATAAKVQHLIGADCPAFDLQAVCSGFVYGLVTAEAYIRMGTARNVLLIAAETMTKLLNWEDRGTCVLFGDGAGAVVLQAQSKQHILAHHLAADGRFYDHLKTEPQGLTMDGKEVFKQAVCHFTNTSKKLMNETGIKPDWFIPHQANKRIIDAVADKLNFPKENVVVTVDQHANTSAASIPLALDVAVRDGRIQSGDHILMAALGGGFTWGGVLVRY